MHFLSLQMNIRTLHTVDTEYSADSIEWCPTVGFHQYFVCGTYQIEENTSTTELAAPTRRKGRIYLYRYDATVDVLEKLDTIETAAILDQKWSCDLSERPILAAANALGEVMLYELYEDRLKLLSTVHLNPDAEKLLTLSIDWSTNSNEDGRQLVASDSKGDITLLRLTENQLEIVSSWNAHSFEAWICCFDKWNSNVVYTGGDDTFLNVYDIRADDTTKRLTNKSHMAGVTTLLSFANKEHMLATGSYDENLRIFDVRSFKNPVSEINLQGGIWRIKPDPFNDNFLLCACMYHNFSIVKLDSEYKEPTLVAEYFEHKSICYGSDWCHQKSADDSLVMTTCSFYDQKMCLSHVRHSE